MIQTKSVYGAKSNDDGYRILVAYEWPQGVQRGKAAGLDWMRSLGPSENLRGWMKRNPRKVAKFQDKYLAELGHNEKGVARIHELLARFGTITILTVPVPAEEDWGVIDVLVKYLRAHCDLI